MKQPTIETYKQSLVPYRVGCFWHPAKDEWHVFSSHEVFLCEAPLELVLEDCESFGIAESVINNLRQAYSITKTTDQLIERLMK